MRHNLTCTSPSLLAARVASACAVLFCALALAVACSDDAGNGGSGVSYGDLVAGDCVAGIATNATPGAGQPDLERVECDAGGAQYRVRQLVIVEAAGDEFPGADFLRTFASTTCGEDSPPALVPTGRQWQSGERFIVCLSDL
jgi:hypothetical protein